MPYYVVYAIQADKTLSYVSTCNKERLEILSWVPTSKWNESDTCKLLVQHTCISLQIKAYF